MPIDMDEINEILSRVRSVSGADAQTPAPSAAEESPSTTAGESSNAAPAVGDPATIQDELLAKMSAVLAAYRDMNSAVTASHSTNQLLHACSELTRKGWLPNSDDATIIADAFTQQEQLFLERGRLRQSCNEAEWEKNRAVWSCQLAGAALRTAAESAGSIPQLESSDLLLAAVDLSERISCGEDVAEPAKQTPLDELTVEQLTALNSMRKAAREAAFPMARALKLTDMVTKAVAALRKVNDIEIVPPVRPTEEEIQRYLRQLEQTKSERLVAHQTLLPMLTARDHLLEELTSSEIALATERQVIAALLEDGKIGIEVQSHKDMADKIASHYDFIRDQLTRSGLKPDSLDGLRKVAQSKTEVRRIAEVRKHLRNLAIALAHFNEANASREVVNNSPEAGTVNLRDVASTCRSWQETVDWRSRKAEQQAVNDRLDRSRRARLDLLQKSAAKYLRDVGDAEDTLSRYLNLIVPPAERPDCDELRMLRRAALHAVSDAVAIKPQKATPDRDDY